jgi:fatty-acyl-CoA synthase
VCTRWVRADLLYEAIEQHKVTHFGGAPIVMNMLLNAADEHKRGTTTSHMMQKHRATDA